MDEILDEMTLREYQTALASSSPTPGGGTAAAVALGHSAALACMVCDLTIGKEKWETGWEAVVQNIVAALAVACRSFPGCRFQPALVPR